MMNIKIEYKGKVHKLGPGLKTFDDIHKDIQLRYSNCFKSGIVIGFIENNALTTLKSFEQLESLAQKMQGGSVKLKVFEGKNLPLN
jgi:invasion protein IalB